MKLREALKMKKVFYLIPLLLDALMFGHAGASEDEVWLQDEFVPVYRPNFPSKLEELQTLADSGDTDALSTLGGIFEGGYGVERNLKAAKKYYGKAARAGHANGIIALRLLNAKRDLEAALRNRKAVSVCGDRKATWDDIRLALARVPYPASEEWLAENGETWVERKLSLRHSMPGRTWFSENISVLAIGADRDLQVVRIILPVLSMTRDQTVALLDLTESLVGGLCPEWDNIGKSARNMIIAASSSWPPRLFLRERDGVTISGIAVVPDIAWLDVSAHPGHDPRTTSLDYWKSESQ